MSQSFDSLCNIVYTDIVIFFRIFIYSVLMTDFYNIRWMLITKINKVFLVSFTSLLHYGSLQPL